MVTYKICCLQDHYRLYFSYTYIYGVRSFKLKILLSKSILEVFKRYFVFFVHYGGPVYSFVNNNNIWLRYCVGEVIDPILGCIPLVYGNIRNKNALYAASLGNRIIEFFPNY